MTQIAILNGIYASGADVRTALPRNMVPVPKSSGISEGYLRPAPGIVSFATGLPGLDRGGINWRGLCYRVMGNKLVQVDADGGWRTLGDVGDGGPVSMDYSFDLLGISSGGRLLYWNGSTLTSVTDVDLGTVNDMIWVDGYFMTTDGEFLVVTELNDPYAVNPLKYGSAEADPDPILAIKKIKTEVFAIGRYTIEAFQNVGGDNFPFQRIPGAQVQRGACGTKCCALFLESLVFVGSGRNEATAVYIASGGATQKISTREVDQILAGYTDEQLALVEVEVKVDQAHQHLLIHLEDQTLVFDGAASTVIQQPVWFTLTTSIVGNGTYRANHLVRCYGKWIVGDTTAFSIGVLSDDVSSHWGNVNGWDFGIQAIYNEGRGAIVNNIELVGLPGVAAFGDNPVIWTSYSVDGKSWSQEKPIQAGRFGETQKRLCWRRQGFMQLWRTQRFRGTSDSHLSFMRLDMTLEPLT